MPFVALSMCFLAATGATGAEPTIAIAEVRVSFTGSSTLHDFGGDAPAVTAPLTRAADGTWSADVAVPVASLDTDNDARDAKMRDMLHADAHPVIRGAFRNVDPDRVRASGELRFTLDVGGVSRPMTAHVADWTVAEDGTRLAFVATFDLSLDAFDLEAPTALLFVRVADTVHVRAVVEVRAGGATG